MATKTLYFTGICKYPKLKTVDEKFGKYQITMYLDQPSWKKFAESKIQVRPKKDEDGEYVKFSCPPKVTFVDGKSMTFGPIETYIREEGGEVKPLTDLIGNGSTVTVKVETYDTKMGKGHRLRGVLVDNLVPYVSKKQQEEGGVEEEHIF